MPYNFAADSFHTKKFCSRLFQKKCDFRRKTAILRIWAPFGDLGATYDDHLRLIGKRIVDFLLVLTELNSLGVTAEALRAIICSKSAISLQWGSADLKFQAEGVIPTNHSFSQKTRINDLLYGIKTCSDLSFILLQFTRLTDGQLFSSWSISASDRGEWCCGQMTYLLLTTFCLSTKWHHAWQKWRASCMVSKSCR